MFLSNNDVKNKHFSVGNNSMVGATVAMAVAVAESRK